MKWYPLIAVQLIIPLVLVAVTDVFTIVQKDLLPDIVRPLSYLVFVVLILLVFIFIVRPAEPMVLARTLAVRLGIIALVLSSSRMSSSYTLSLGGQGSCCSGRLPARSLPSTVTRGSGPRDRAVRGTKV